MGPRLLLFTTVDWPFSARLAGAFAGVGAQVSALLPQDHICGQSRFLESRHAYRPLFPLTSLRRAISAAAPDLLVPCDDHAVVLLRLLHAAGGSATALVERSLGRIEKYGDLARRGVFIAAARAAGIVAPQTLPLGSERDLDTALASFGFPAVLKTDGSWGGDGVAIVRNVRQARAAFRRLSAQPSRLRSAARAVLRHDAHFLRDALHPPAVCISLQRFVPGAPATTAMACWNGNVLASIHMDVLESIGATGPASVMRRTYCPQMELAAVRLAERFGLSGLHGLDFVRDTAGQPHLIEINPRATPSSAFALGPGHDLAAALAGCVSPSVRDARPLLTANPVIALFPQEWRRNPISPWLYAAYLDVPWDDPALLRACLEPGEPLPRPERLGLPTLLTGAAQAGTSAPH